MKKIILALSITFAVACVQASASNSYRSSSPITVRGVNGPCGLKLEKCQEEIEVLHRKIENEKRRSVKRDVAVVVGTFLLCLITIVSNGYNVDRREPNDCCWTQCTKTSLQHKHKQKQ